MRQFMRNSCARGSEGSDGNVDSSVKAGGLGRKLHTHEEKRKLDILMLIGIEDVDVVILNKKIDDGDDNALTVGAIDEEYGGCHRHKYNHLILVPGSYRILCLARSLDDAPGASMRSTLPFHRVIWPMMPNGLVERGTAPIGL